MTFYDREEELTALQEEFTSEGHGFYVLYGRRRVGKTALLKEFCAQHPHIYFLAAEEGETRQRNKLVEKIADRFDERPPRIESWDEALTYLGEKLIDCEDLIVAIDEFPYLVEENGSLPSYIQAFVDETLPETASMLVLCGSSVSTMESSVLGHKSPLHGRRTGQIDLQPFTFQQARLINRYPIHEAIRSFSITGGMPMYLELFDYEEELTTNIQENILSPTSILYNEPEFLLRTELRNPARYRSILEAVALGHTTPNAISGATNIDPGPLSKYLKTLRGLRLLERRVPVTAAKKKSKRSRYRVADPFLRFWFRYVEPNRSSIEQAPDMVLEGTITPDLPNHVSTTFETVCHEALWSAIREGHIPPFSNVGPWWYGEEEIDIVGLDPANDRILFAECKWTHDPVDPALVEDLKAKAEAVRWGPPSREERFALFSKSGFTEDLHEMIDPQWTLFDLSDIDTLLSP